MQPARVVSVTRETPSTVTVAFEPASPLIYRPGQFVQVELLLGRGRYRRSYSLSSVPADAHPTITVKHVPGGKVSEYFNRRIAPGDQFRVSAAEGSFVLPDSRAGRRFVMLAGGSGIVPVISLLRTLLAMPAPPAVTLLYYSHSSADIIFREALHALAGKHPQLDLRLFVTGPRESWDGPVEPFSARHVQDMVESPVETLYYMCGPESLLENIRTTLELGGVDPSRLFAEHFSSPPVRERPASGHSVTFITRGPFRLPRLVRAHGRAGESLLDVAERHGVKARSRCRNGYCGACKATLLRGDIAMDEPNGLSPNDAAAGKVLTCISYASTPVILDLRG